MHGKYAADGAGALALMEVSHERVLEAASGRRYGVRTSPDDVDTLVIRGKGQEIVLRIEVDDDGPVLRFSGARLALAATETVTLEAKDVSLRASSRLRIDAGHVTERVAGDCAVLVGGQRQTTIEGEERIEAGAVAMQANDGGVAVRAMRRIALDGEHIGLNDEPAPRPFDWSTLGEDTPT